MGVAAAAGAGPFPTWTRTLSTDDAGVLLDAAVPGMPLAEWRELGDRVLPQPNRPRRREAIRLVEADLLDHVGTTIKASSFLRLFQEGSPHRRRGLFAARVGGRSPLLAAALDAVIHPILARADEPLAAPDAAQLRPEEWDPFLLAVLPPGTGRPSIERTRRTLQRMLVRAGVIASRLNSYQAATVQHGRPDTLAYAWALADELRRTGRAEAPRAWALSDAFAARLFAPLPEHAGACVEAGVAEGLLHESHLAGAPRLRLGEDA